MSAGLRAGTNNDGYLQINGTDVLTALSSGRIGVGTTNPSAVLDVKVATDAKLLVQDGNATGNVKFNAVNNAVTGNVNFEIAAQDIQLFGGGSERLRVTSTGNIGIGTTNPPNLLTLGASGGPVMRLVDTTSGAFSILIGGSNGDLTFSADHGNTGSSTNIIFSNDGNQERLRVTSAGNIGIGTTNPFTKLDTRGALHVGGGTDGIWLGNAGDNSAYDNVKLYYTGYNGGGPRIYLTPRTQPGSGTINTFLHLQSNFTGGPGANTMGLLVDGPVGIGTNSPQHKLHVVSGGIVGGSGRGGIYTKTLCESNDATGAYWEFQTTPTSTINDILFSRGSTGNYGIVGYDNSVDKMRFYTANGWRMTIDNAGNVGFGTTTPSQKLDIIGAIKLQGASTPNSLVSSIIYKNFNSSGFDIVRLDARTGANIYEGVFAIQTNDVSGTMSDRLQVASNGTVSIGTSTQRQKLTVNGDIGIYKGVGHTRIFTVKGAIGTYSTLTITVNQYDYGSFVYDLKMHGYAGSYLHYAGGAYENGGIYNAVTTIAQKSASATFTGPTYVSGHTWTITVNWSSAWTHPVAEFSISGGGYFSPSESDISMVWS